MIIADETLCDDVAADDGTENEGRTTTSNAQQSFDPDDTISVNSIEQNDQKESEDRQLHHILEVHVDDDEDDDTIENNNNNDNVPPAAAADTSTGAINENSNSKEALRPFVIISSSYLLFTVTDGAIRMIVLLHAYSKNFSALEVAIMFTLYELAGVFTNLVGDQ